MKKINSHEETMTICLKLPNAEITAVPDGDGYLITFNYDEQVLVRHARPFTEKYTASQFEKLKRQGGCEESQ